MVEIFPSWLYHVMDTSRFLVFHNIAEFFSVMVSLSIFGVGWFSFEQSQDRHVLFLSATFLAVGLMDTMHALGYPWRRASDFQIYYSYVPTDWTKDNAAN